MLTGTGNMCSYIDRKYVNEVRYLIEWFLWGPPVFVQHLQNLHQKDLTSLVTRVS